jgi:hypothetical protein
MGGETSAPRTQRLRHLGRQNSSVYPKTNAGAGPARAGELGPRKAEPDTLVIANGFSCQEQIGQGAGRHALYQERGTVQEAEATAPARRRAAGRTSLAETAAFFAAGLVLGGLAAWALTRRTSA